ncbi:hypothetical protein [Lactobacillus corticis]|uniref:Lipoprotein n=1 Tax=Lactobacillus corticis TaxID=2201249 RepID=A0A916QJ45_9LACO|nr:hypothetical protein [Lactobacillus corticis]GFZ27443.1 hypothetical protein LCB40_13230 [Lactobacillus corticis]
MKKQSLIYLLPLCALLLAGCGANSTSKSNSSQSSSSSAVSSKKAKKQKKAKAKSTSSSSSAAKSSSSASSSTAKTQTRMQQLTSNLRQVFPGMLLPTQDGLGQGADKLNVRYSANNAQNVVYYSVGNQPLAFNSPQVSQELPYAVLTQYKHEQNSGLIHYQAPQRGLPKENLDENIQATVEGAAGSTYVNWKIGNYSFVVRGINQFNHDPVAFAKKALLYYKIYGLPQTSTKAAFYVTMGDAAGSLNTIVTWQHGNTVYQLKAHDTQTAFKMLSSLK